MPNWTQNIMIVRGTKTALDYFLKKYIDSTGNFDFEKVIPEPKTEDECPEKYIVKEVEGHISSSYKPWFNWYDWRVDNWGTKWNSSSTMVSPVTLCTVTRTSKRANKKSWYEVEINYDTAWAPPDGVISALQDEFHDAMINGDIEIDHYYLGEFSEFVGRVIGLGDNECYEYGSPGFKKFMIMDGWETEESYKELFEKEDEEEVETCSEKE